MSLPGLEPERIYQRMVTLSTVPDDYNITLAYYIMFSESIQNFSHFRPSPKNNRQPHFYNFLKLLV